MSWGTPDVYYQPEEFKLSVVGELNDPEACYSFDDLVVWQHEDGRLFWATDSGCSCPSPFERYTRLEQLNEITDDTWDEFAEAVTSHCIPGEYRYDELGVWGYHTKHDPQGADKTELLAKVFKLL